MKAPAPSYDDLPEAAPGYLCSWQYFNSLQLISGQKDQLGTINFLTPERRAQAASEEIRSGKSITLDLPIDYFAADSRAFGGRPPPVHTLNQVSPFSAEDALTFNTQSASQWDGFRHFAIRSTEAYYNGHKAYEFSNSDALGIHAWVENGGVSGRGVLIDFASWAENQQLDIVINSGFSITLRDILKVLDFQGTSIRPGDILIFRTGWLKWYQQTEPNERHEELCIRHQPGTHRFIGLEQSREFVAWLWNNQIAAVAGDQVAFESTPPPDNGFGWLHEHLLACLGCPIGELWNTEELARECKERGKYTFFVSSAPLYIRGGVASPSNAMAVF